MPALTSDEFRLIDAYWRAANYLSVGQIYLLDNPLLREPLKVEHVKPRLLGHWGTTPGLNLLYVHMNRAIRERALNAIFVTGPGHGGPGLVANTYLEGTYSEIYPRIARGRGGAPAAVPPVLVPGGCPVPCGPRNPRIDPRGRRAGLFAGPRVRRRLRQPRPAGTVRDRRRRIGDRRARRQLAFEQVREPGQGRRGPSRPSPERLQDREPHGPGANPQGRAARAARGLWARPSVRRGRRPGGGSSRARRSARRVPRPDRGVSAARARRRWGTPALADDRAAHAKGLDGAEGGRRPTRRGQLPLAPGPAGGHQRESGAPAAPRRVAALVSPDRALRRRGGAPRRAARAAA